MRGDSEGGAFERLVKIVRYDLAEPAPGVRDGDAAIPKVELELTVKPNDVRLEINLEGDNFIPGVATQTATTVDGGTLDDLAQGAMDDLVARALRVGRLQSEPVIRPARRAS